MITFEKVLSTWKGMKVGPGRIKLADLRIVRDVSMATEIEVTAEVEPGQVFVERVPFPKDLALRTMADLEVLAELVQMAVRRGASKKWESLVISPEEWVGAA